MRFSAFITANLDSILEEWDAYASTLLPAATTMSDADLRDHAREILLAIVVDMERSQTEEQRAAKSRQVGDAEDDADSAAATHGGSRQTSGFDLLQLVGEFRALRASVLALWSRSHEASAGRAAAEEIARFNEALDQALAGSVARYSADLARSRDIFLAVLGHDVRGPLSGILMAADVLLAPQLQEAARVQVALRIRRASENIGRLTNDLIEFTRSRLGRGLPIEPLACDLSALCEEALDAVRFSHPDRSFEQQLAGDPHIDVDRERMRQLLSNLLHNAVQHGDRDRPIHLGLEGGKDEVVLRVANFGAPIAPELMAVMFDPLVSARRHGSTADDRSRTSLGLGLFIVREIVQGHHGTVTVDSAAHTGTVFTVRLPRVRP